MPVRVGIREQLGALVLTATLTALAVISIPTWIYVNTFVVDVELAGLSLTASLKASQVSSEIELIRTTCKTISTRILIQKALGSFYETNGRAVTGSLWKDAILDLSTALNGNAGSAASRSANLLQARIYSRNETGKSDRGLMSITAQDVGEIRLPYNAPNGSAVFLGDTVLGFPASLYPNISYHNTSQEDPAWAEGVVQVARPWADIRIDNSVNGLIIGPIQLNDSYSLMSLTIPIRQIDSPSIILGYMTMVAEATSLIQIMHSREGLGDTGSVLIVGPNTAWNRFGRYNLAANSTTDAAGNFSSVDVKFVIPPPAPGAGRADRHSKRNFNSGHSGTTFKVADYPAVFHALAKRNPAVNNATAMLWTVNEEDRAVSAGVARPQTGLVNWTLVVEMDMDEALAPIDTLRKILLGCVFGTAGLIMLLVVPCAHFSVRPIRALKAATEKSVALPGYDDVDHFEDDDDDQGEHHDHAAGHSMGSEKVGWLSAAAKKLRRVKKPTPSENDSDPRRRTFKIPGRVKDVRRRRYITDELTELTKVFNDMGEELLKQYTSLDRKVAERTSELEISKRAAEAANESKTLFIANISHELKTPLNGILGMCELCLADNDLDRVKQSLKLLYKSGDLLLHLLEDLLSFSKNQIGQQLSLELKEFRLGDIRSQILTIFDKQVREAKIDFSLKFLSTDGHAVDGAEHDEPDGNVRLPAIGPSGVGRLKDMCLWGDQHRILQVLINLVSNSLKFTPAGGQVKIRIKCLDEMLPTREDASRSSSFSKTSNRPGRGPHAYVGTANTINPAQAKPLPQVQVQVRERRQSSPPPSAKTFMFEFEVEDTGPGIPEHMHQQVFEPFMQGDLGLSKQYGGTGLGLSICQQLASLMGGSITLKSTIGFGTTFTLRIPLKYTKDRVASTASSTIASRPASRDSSDGENRRNSSGRTSVMGSPDQDQRRQSSKMTASLEKPRLVGLSVPYFTGLGPQPDPGQGDQIKAMGKDMAKDGKLRVLVADDNTTNIEVVRRMLKLEDVYDVTIAKDGQEAYDLVKAEMDENRLFDVIFMDVQMPRLDGLESTRLIRKMGYSAPIVALTAFSEESNIKDCMASGMDEFLAKPIRRPALKQVLKRIATIVEEPETSSVGRRSITPVADSHSQTAAKAGQEPG